MTRAALISLGCFKNQVDSEIVAGLLSAHNVRIVSEDEPFEILIINTCGFIQDAKKESLEEISAALELKNRNPQLKVVVMGCFAQRYFKEIKENFKQIDLLWGVNDLEELAEAISKGQAVQYNNRRLFLQQDHPRLLFNTNKSSYLKISEGCSQRCSFCAIPLIRGPLRSRQTSVLLKEAEKLLNQGVVELNIISQSTTSFGRDFKPPDSLPNLLRSLSGFGFKWIRLLYLLPEEVNDQLIEAFTAKDILPYFDLPFQHCSEKILRLMLRGGNPEKNLKLIEKIRKNFPNAVFRTSLIVGFPGESDADFNLLKSFLKTSKIERTGIFAYSDEEQTAAFDLQPKVPSEVIAERVEKLKRVASNNLRTYNQKLLDTQQQFLAFAPSPWREGYLIGRIWSQAPEVDGWCEIKRNFSAFSKIQHAKITAFKNEVLFGE